MQCLKIGSKVYIGDDILGTIVSITIFSESYFTYLIEWWDGRDRNLESIHHMLVRPAAPEHTMEIGFINA